MKLHVVSSATLCLLLVGLGLSSAAAVADPEAAADPAASEVDLDAADQVAADDPEADDDPATTGGANVSSRVDPSAGDHGALVEDWYNSLTVEGEGGVKLGEQDEGYATNPLGFLFQERWRNPRRCSEQCACGVHYEAGTKITNGEEAVPNAYPWMVALINRLYRLVDCGGSIVSSKFVITAASCFNGFSPDDYVVRIREHNLAEDDNRVYDLNIKNVVVHEYYQFFSDFDIAAVELATELDFQRDRLVRPICLPVPFKNYYRKDVKVAGWGELFDYGPQPDELRVTNLTVLSTRECRRGYGVSSAVATFNRICAVGDNTKDCFFDNGGPLMFKKPFANTYTLVGLSLATDCSDPSFPNVFTRVSNFVAWIHRAAKLSTFCGPCA